MAFAQLAEECRRSGGNEEAVSVCRAGLAHHPGYLSARVTLSRALIELGKLDEAQTELDIVLTAAPDNLPANRALAEILQQRGQLAEALEQYRRALLLSKYDPTLEHEVARLENALSPPPPKTPTVDERAAAIEELFDFDAFLQQLDAGAAPKPELPQPDSAAVTAAPSALDNVTLEQDDSDPFSVLERQLRENDGRRPEPDETGERERRVMAELEDWLSAILADRRDQPSA
jgi:tetratricopeptide (TPR) repeat protein